MDKFRDISRGVLPSTHRKAARDNLRNIKQRNRRSINRQLAKIDSIDTYLDDPRIEDLEFYPDADIHYAVRERRDGDKLSVVNWARERTRKEGITDPHERYAFVKKALPDNTIGRHALTHAATAEGFCDGTGGGFRSGCPDHSFNHHYGVRDKPKRKPDREELVAFFRDLITQPGMHLALNREIKKLHRPSHLANIPGTFAQRNGRYCHLTEYVYCAGCTRPRVLAGSHDVEAWVGDVFYPHHKDLLIHSWWRQGFGVQHRQLTPFHKEWQVAALKFLPEDAVVRLDGTLWFPLNN